MWSIALETLIADRAKLLTALVGVIFAIVLVNVQGGFFLGLIGRASLLVDYSQADIWAGHRQMHNVDLPRDVPRRWVYRIRGVPGVRDAEPYLLGVTEATLPSGGYAEVVVVGTEPQARLGTPWNLVQGSLDSMLKPSGIVVDQTEADKLDHPTIGSLREIGGRRARVVGMTRGIMGFLVFPYVFTTYDRAAAYLHKPPEFCSYFLVDVEPGADVHQVCDSIRQRIPEIDAYPRDEYSWVSIRFWLTRTGLGISFGAATLLGLLVGVVMVAQTLYALVLDRLVEFGTLKAIGATERQIFAVLLVQAFAMAAVGWLAGLGLTWAIQSIYSTPRAPIVIPWWLSLGSGFLVLGICVVSSLLPYLRIRKLDPMIVLQG
ncbi:MAG: ABC transporter permease [Thermoguttaceae bacterium]|jgi:putative ABC transport system permease protein|nr:ABC transporter permease [Thermoguttaceae bacterium]